jgi:hypothetical protein
MLREAEATNGPVLVGEQLRDSVETAGRDSRREQLGICSFAHFLRAARRISRPRSPLTQHFPC